MRSFMREKKIYCGDNYREVDIYAYTQTQAEHSRRGKRSKKEKVSEPKQRNLNDKNARRYLIQLGNTNFNENDLHVTLTYKNKYLPASIEDAEKTVKNYLRRVKGRRVKEKLPPLKYILVSEYRMRKDSVTPIRIHHHIIMNGGVDRDVIEAMWTKERIKWKKWETDIAYRNEIYKKSLGFINADRLQPDENGIAALCNYLTKHPNGKKRWSCSQNLDKPYSRTNDSKYSHREVARIAQQPLGREYWERRYPGWTIVGGDYGEIAEYNDQTGWSIYLKLCKKESG